MTCKVIPGWNAPALKKKNTGAKDDHGKQSWYPIPLALVKLLAPAFIVGVKKYHLFSCVERFDNPNERFYDAQMRHTEACQIDPLAIDKESLEKYGVEVYHSTQVAFNALMRLYHCLKEKGGIQ